MPLKSGGAVDNEHLRGRSSSGLISIGGFVPNTVTTLTYYPSHPHQKNVCRTSDGTIHALIRGEAGVVTHFYSRNDGKTWIQGDDVWNVTRTCSIDVDADDNLVAVRGETVDGIHFKKATVTKNATWTWSWGADVEINAGPSVWYPDIVADGNNYYHIVYYYIYGIPSTTAIYWERSIDGGVTWTRTELTDLAAGISTGIVKDENNNLYVFTYFNTDYLKAVKITYSAGPSWSIGTVYNVSHIISVTFMSLSILTNGKLVVTYIDSTTADLFFRKSTNAYDLSAWDTQVQITTALSDPDYQYGSIMVLSNTRIRVYHGENDYLNYQESTDGGVTFGTKQIVWQTGVNGNVNVSKKAVGSKIDFIWGNSLPAIYHSYVYQ